MSSTTYVIYRFSRPTKKELSSIDHYSAYDSFWVNDEEFIQLYRQTDTKVKNIVSKPFARKLQLPEKEIDYENMEKTFVGICRNLCFDDFSSLFFVEGHFGKGTR